MKFFVAVTAITLLFSQSAFAGDAMSGFATPQYNGRVKDRDFATLPLQSMPDFPRVPRYTGQAQFLFGVSYPNAPGGASCTAVLNAREEPQIVTQWYDLALKQGGWNVAPCRVNGSTVRADQDGNFIEIKATKSGTNPGCRVTMFYRAVTPIETK